MSSDSGGSTPRIINNEQSQNNLFFDNTADLLNQPSQMIDNNTAQTPIIPKPTFYLSDNALPPFYVICESEKSDIGSFHPMQLGRIFKNANITDIKEISKRGRNRVCVETFTANGANDLINSNILKEKNIKTYIPAHMTSCQGVVRGIDTSFSEEELLQHIESSRKVIGIRRFNRRTINNGESSLTPTGTICITFEGRILPKCISIFKYSCEVNLYIRPVIQCYNCLRFGHTKKQCRSKLRCQRCGGEHQSENCSYNLECIYCGEEHTAIDRQCKEYTRQKNIKDIMAFDNLSYYEASQKIPGTTNPNKAQAKSRSRHPSDYPQLPTKTNIVEEDININNRRLLANRHAGSKSYSLEAKKRKSPDTNLHQELHNECLLFPHGNSGFKHGPIVNLDNSKITVSELEKMLVLFKKSEEFLSSTDPTLQSSINNILKSLSRINDTNNFHNYATPSSSMEC